MSAYTSSHWSGFAGAQVAASAALLGLVFVGLTIDLREVVTSSRLVHRAAEAVILLGSALATSTAVLIPDQRKDALSTELIVLAAATFGLVLFLQRDAVTQPADGEGGPPRGSLAVRRVSGLGAPVFVAIAGVSLAAGAGGGLYWWPVAVLVAYIGALIDAWVLLIEILR